MTADVRTGQHCRLLTEFAELERLAPAWEALWQDDVRREIFGTFGWARAWWHAAGGRRVLCTPVVYRGDQPIGFLPLAREDRTLRFLSAPHADYNDLLCTESDSGAILEHALRQLLRSPSWDRAVLENVPEGSRLLGCLGQLPPDLRGRLEVCASGTSTALDLREDRAARLQACLGKGHLKRDYKRLSKLGELRFRHLEEAGEIEAHLPNLFRMHIARRALAADRSLFCREEGRSFYCALVQELDPRKELRFCVLDLNGRPIAYHLGFECAGKFTWYKPTFDVGYWDYSPGFVFMKPVLEYIAGRDIQEFDFTTGDEAYKGRFANRVRPQYTLHFFPARARGRAHQMALRAKGYVKSRPRLAAVVRSVAGTLSTTCGQARAALRHEGLGGAGRKLLRGAWRAAVRACDEVLVFSCGGGAPTGAPVTPEPDVQIEPGTLAELAMLFPHYPDVIHPQYLHTARERLKRGDQVFIARRGGAVAAVAWVGTPVSPEPASGTGPTWHDQLPAAALVISDCWTPPALRGQKILSHVLKALAADTLRKHQQVWFTCSVAAGIARREAEEVGFRLSCRWRQVHWFGRPARAEVRPVCEAPRAAAGNSSS
jgi:CelD/BcsL family acetyltransferase involved in cellulose biosynthesis